MKSRTGSQAAYLGVFYFIGTCLLRFLDETPCFYLPVSKCVLRKRDLY